MGEHTQVRCCVESVLSVSASSQHRNDFKLAPMERKGPGLFAVSWCWPAAVSVDQDRFTRLLSDSLWRKECFKVAGRGINAVLWGGLKTNLLLGRPAFWTRADCCNSQMTPASRAETAQRHEVGEEAPNNTCRLT